MRIMRKFISRIKVPLIRMMINIPVICMFFTFSNAGTLPEKGNPQRKNVLFVSLHQIDMPADRLAVQAIHEEFQKSPGFSIELYYEYLDTIRFRGEAHLGAKLDYLKKKYQGTPIDLVLVGNRRMLEIWNTHMKAVLPHAPVVFYDMNIKWLPHLPKIPGSTGVAGDVDLARSVRWFMSVRPSVREIIIVHGAGEADKLYRINVTSLVEEMRGEVKFSDWSGLPLEQMKRRAAALPKTSAIIFSLLFEDAAGITYRPIDALRELTSVSSVPVLCAYDQFIGTGAVGGYLYSIETQARGAARMGLLILGGAPVSGMPVAVTAGSHFIFDHGSLLRWGISLSNLPRDSIVKNRRYSFYEEHRFQIIAVIISFIILLIFIVILTRITYNLRRARLELFRMNEILEKKVEERTSQLFRINETLRESEEKFRILAEQSPVMIFINRGGRVVYANPKCEETMGYTREEFYSDDFDFRTLIAPEYLGVVDESFRKHSNGEDVPRMDYVLLTKECRRIYAIITTKLIRFEDSPAILGIVTDITDRKQTENALRRTEANLRALMNATNETMFLMESGGIIIDLNDITAARLNTTPLEMRGRSMYDFLPPETAAHRIVIVNRVAETCRPEVFEDERYGRRMEHHVFPIADEEGRVSRVGIFARDITDQRKAEEKIHYLLHEKDIILKEVHHRVKNNMNVILGLLNLQADALEEPVLKSALLGAAGRIRSMMVLYDKLYRSETVKEMSLKEYLPDLINEIVRIFPIKIPLEVRTRVDDIVVAASKLSPVGIIINELITNTMKYAFDGRDRGVITVTASGSGGHVSLIFEDDGVGFPGSCTSGESPGFGLQLVGLLVKQIRGSLAVEGCRGTRISIEFEA